MKMSEPALLETIGLNKVFPAGGTFRRKWLKAVDNFNLRMHSDKPVISALAGESGSGKTTIARLILGLTKPTSGEVRYKGKNIHKMSKGEMRDYRREVQAIFQDPFGAYNPFYRVNRILELPIKKFKLASSKAEAHRMIDEALKEVGLTPEEILGKYPHELSGGQRQRLMLARAFLMEPKILVADEPVSMIDASMRAGILSIIQHLKKKLGMSCLYITHDLSIAYNLSDEITILFRGRTMERGSIDIIKKPAHPYTQLLIQSVPLPNPKKRWTENVKISFDRNFRLTEATRGCIFYGRCPKATERCAEEVPRLISVGKNHEVACLLYS